MSQQHPFFEMIFWRSCTKRMITFLLLIMTTLVHYGQSQDVVSSYGMTSTEYQSEHTKWTGEGYRLKQVSAYAQKVQDGNTVVESPRFTAIWIQEDGPEMLVRKGLKRTKYRKLVKKFKLKGFRVVCVSGYSINGKDYYAAIWHKEDTTSIPYMTHNFMTFKKYKKRKNQYTAQGYRLTWVSAYTFKGKDRYAAIWEMKSGNEYIAKQRMSSSTYQSYLDQYESEGYRLILVSGYERINGVNYAAIWEKTSGPTYSTRYGMSESNYQAAFYNQYYRSSFIEFVVGYLVGDLVQYSAIWHSKDVWNEDDLNHIDTTVETFLVDNQIEGASLAITKNGRLVFAQGYGLADVENNLDASPHHLWRVASISKPVTAVAIMKLKEEGQLTLDDKVFGTDSILGCDYAACDSGYDEREKQITVRHLLEHSAGGAVWNSNGSDGSSDPVFGDNKALSPDDLIKKIIEERTPSADPGTTYSYSNFGYCILGRIIEKLTNQSYESYVRDFILSSMNATDMFVGGNLSDRKPNEAVYYSNPTSTAYIYYLQHMDSFGGWITSPINLLKFMVQVDGFSSVSDFLLPETITEMTTPSAVNSYKGLGWSVNSANNWWHTGSLPGTQTILARISNGEYTWTFLCNNRQQSPNVDSLMWQVKNGVNEWPTIDLFEW